jgi:hypothetical protein
VSRPGVAPSVPTVAPDLGEQWSQAEPTEGSHAHKEPGSGRWRTNGELAPVVLGPTAAAFPAVQMADPAQCVHSPGRKLVAASLDKHSARAADDRDRHSAPLLDPR